MSDAYIGEIRIVAFNFAPVSWAACDGQILPITQNTALFSILGTQYGGNGTSNFSLPNLQSSAPLHSGQGPGLSDYLQGQTGGVTGVTLNSSQLPSHSHTASAAAAGSAVSATPSGAAWGAAGRDSGAVLYTTSNSSDVAMSSAALGVAGGGQPHNNMPPYLVMFFIICLSGVFPPRS